MKKCLHQRWFTCEYIRTFWASAGRSCMSSAFLIKFRVVYWRAAALLRYWPTIDLRLKKILFLFFFKQLVFCTFSKKNLKWILFIAKLQSENCRLITLLKETPSKTHQFQGIVPDGVIFYYKTGLWFTVQNSTKLHCRWFNEAVLK